MSGIVGDAANTDGRGERRQPAWFRLAVAPLPVLVPVLVPVIVLALALGFSAAGDSEPSSFVEPATGFVPGAAAVTGWHQDESVVPAGFGPGDPGYASPQALVDAMVAQARQAAAAEPWITGTIVNEGADAADARVYVPLPAYEEGYVAAELFLVVMRDPDGWHVDEAHVRFHCRREARYMLCG